MNLEHKNIQKPSNIGLSIVSIIGLTFNIYLLGTTVVNLWSWFVVPLGVLEITKSQAIGVGLIISMYMYTYSPEQFKDKTVDDLFLETIYTAVVYLGTLLMGYIIHIM